VSIPTPKELARIYEERWAADDPSAAIAVANAVIDGLAQEADRKEFDDRRLRSRAREIADWLRSKKVGDAVFGVR